LHAINGLSEKIFAKIKILASLRATQMVKQSVAFIESFIWAAF
jgi:hypothetical protein